MSFDTLEANAAFAEKYRFGFSLISDTGRAMGVAYGAAVDDSARAARRIGVIVNPDGRVHQVWTQVNPRSFPREALEALPA